jgi:hypothetical protein
MPILNKRNRSGGRGEKGEKEREEAKKRKISERIANQITREFHNEKIQQSYL